MTTTKGASVASKNKVGPWEKSLDDLAILHELKKIDVFYYWMHLSSQNDFFPAKNLIEKLHQRNSSLTEDRCFSVPTEKLENFYNKYTPQKLAPDKNKQKLVSKLGALAIGLLYCKGNIA